MLGDVSIDPEVAIKLGKNGLADVLTYLWAVDCQTCGQSLDGRAPSVCVDDVEGAGQAAVASLHHQACQRSRWGDMPELRFGEFLTFLTQCLLLPDEYLGGSTDMAAQLGLPRPMMIVNPSLEMIAFERSAAGGWSLMTNLHRHLGMRPPGKAALDRPITAGSVTIDRDTVDVRLGDSVWSAPGGSDAIESIGVYGGITLLITSALGPGSHELLDTAFFAGGRYERAWLRLAR
jgi:hypothetical protein